MSPPRTTLLLLAALPLLAAACRREPPPAPADAVAAQPDAAVVDDAPSTAPDAAADATSDATLAADDAAPLAHAPRCPRDMVLVDARLCVDRYESTLEDDRTGKPLSPHYPPEPGMPERMFDLWTSKRLDYASELSKSMPLPLVPAVELAASFVPRAVARKGVVPQGYVSGKVAAAACLHAHKRLCTHDEWTLACRGERRTRFPYGDEYRSGTCNVYRVDHPAALLHGNASAGHSDPRLGLVKGEDGVLLRKTGATRDCASRWGDDAVYDMVGNVDEWVDDPDGTFVGGFFSRSTRSGCDAAVKTHPYEYWDYSTGIRCCREPE